MTKVYAVRVHQHGGPEVLRYEEVEVGRPGPGEARVRHAAIGLNFTDIHFRTGRYPLKELPHVIGMEAAGVVEEVGPGVTEVRVGERVAYASEKPRAYAQATVMPVTRLVGLPDFVDDATAAAAILKGLTAQYLLRGAYAVKPGETILVHAAAGGVGLIMCQWARHLGARVIGTVSTEEKAALAKANGCEHPIVTTGEDVVARVRDLTGGEGVPVVYDGVGAATFEQSLQQLAAARPARLLRLRRRSAAALGGLPPEPHGLALPHQRRARRLHPRPRRDARKGTRPVRYDEDRSGSCRRAPALPARGGRAGATRP